MLSRKATRRETERPPPPDRPSCWAEPPLMPAIRAGTCPRCTTIGASPQATGGVRRRPAVGSSLGGVKTCPPFVLLVASVVLLLCPVEPAAGMTPVDPVGQWPLQPQPVVVHPFDPPSVSWGSGHRGVDLAGHLGQP